MSPRRRIVAALALLAGRALAGPDPVELAVRDAYDPPLRWVNVAERPLWVAGVAPEYDADSGLALLHLRPGAEATLRLPAYTALRLAVAKGRLVPDQVEIRLANASALAVRFQPVPGEDGRSLVVYPESPEALLVRVGRPAGARAALAVAAFVSRREVADDLAPYRNLVVAPGPSVWLRRGGYLEGQRFWPLLPGQRLCLRLRGPRRYAVVQRLRHEPEEHAVVQDWRLKVRLGERPPQWLESSADPESTHPVYVNEAAESLSQEQTAFLEVPDGVHRVEFETDRPLYLRLLEQQDSDYLLPELNQPRRPAAEARDRLGLIGRPAESHRAPAPGNADGLAGDLLASERAAHGNVHRGGPLAAVERLNQAARRHPGYPVLRQAAEDLRGLRSFYRDLPPAEKAAPGQFRAHFLPPRLREPGELPEPATVAEQHLDEWLARLPDGLFTPLAPGQTQRYRLPPRLAPGWLEVAVDRRGQPGRRALWLRLDQQPPVSLRLDPIPEELDADDLAPRPTLAALRLLAARHGLGGPPTQSGAYAAREEPAPLIDAGQFELHLPREIRTVTLWQEGGPTLAVSLRYRADRNYALGEAGYRAALARVRRPLDWFFTLLRAPDMAPATNPYCEDLRQDWLPVQRLIRTEAAQFAVAVSPPGPEAAADPATAAVEAAAARAAEAPLPNGQNGDPLAALEHWGRAARAGGPAAEAARLAQAALLRGLGETYLAEGLWRQLVLYGGAAEHRQEAARRLEAWYREHDDRLAVRQLRSALLVREPTPEALAALAESLVDTGEYAAALRLTALSPTPEAAGEWLARAALREGWTATLRRWAAAAPAPARRLWLGWLAQRDGDPAAAEALWRNAGPAAAPWLRALRRGRALARPGDTRPEPDWLAAWQAWWRDHPGPRQWLDGSHWVWDYPGAATYYSLDRDVYGPAYRAEPDFPLRLGVIGPARLRLRVRPLHPADPAAAPLDDWLRLHDGAGLSVFPLTNNTATEGLALAEDAGLKPGQEVPVEYIVGPGWHDLALLAERAAIAVQVDEWTPELPLAALPPVRPGSLGGAWPEPAGTRFLGLGAWLGRPAWPAATVPLDDLPPSALYGGPLAPAAGRRKFGPPPPPDALAAALGRGDFAAVAALPDPAPADVAARVAALAYVVEHRPGEAQAALGRAESLWRRHGGDDAVNEIWQRLVRHGRWEPVPHVARTAGVRKISVAGWRPSEPYLRIRRALMPPTGDDELVLADTRPLVLSMDNPEPATLDFQFRPLDIAFLPGQDVAVDYQLDEQPPRSLRLPAGTDWVPLRLAVPAGAHALRLTLAGAPANLFLRVRASEAGLSLVIPTEYIYHLAAPGAPLEFDAAGPGWLRVDRLNGDAPASEYRELAPGWRRERVEAADGEQPLRLFQHQAAPVLHPIAPRVARREVIPVPPTPLAAPGPATPARLRLADAFPLNLGQYGTWSLALSGMRRNNLREDTSPAGPEQFLEYSLAHRRRSEDDVYFRTRLLGRLRQHGGASFGLEHANQFQFSQALFARFDGNLFAQAPEGSPEFSLLARGSVGAAVPISPKTVLWPMASLFVRHLSLHPAEVGPGRRLDPRNVDQDIYTPYKSSHRSGSILGLEARHRPWLDTLWTIAGAVVSNQNLNPFSPDHFGLEAGWDQQLGPVTAHLGYNEQFFLRDADRPRAIDRGYLDLGLHWNGWFRELGRLQLGLNYTHDFSRDTDLTMFTLAWHESEGRGLRDFWPGELLFPGLMRRDTPDAPNDQANPVQGF